MLNRIILWHGNGKGSTISCEVDPRHVEIIISEFGVQSAKSLASPIVKVDVDVQSEKFDDISISKCKSLVARANYLVAGRPGIQYACKRLSTAMAGPTIVDYDKLKVLARYLVGRPRVVHVYRRQKHMREVVACTDASWVGDNSRTKYMGRSYPHAIPLD